MFCIRLRASVFQTEPQIGDEMSTCTRSTSAVASSAYSTTDVTPCTDPSDRTTTSACMASITIDYPVNEVKKTLARHIACCVADLSKPRASIGGGRGGTRPPTFQRGGQHRNCPPPLFSSEKLRGI